MARSRADALNTYDQLLHPFDGWTFGAYAHEAGQFGLGESKGAVNFVAGSVVDLSPALQIADAQVEGRLSAPIAATGTQAEGGGFIQPVLIGASFLTGEGEVAAVEGGAAKLLARVTRARGGGCFVAGTLVQMADGTTEPIEQIRAGDLVKSRDPKTGVTEARRVLQTTVRQTDAVLALSLTDPKTGRRETVTTTGEHPFYVNGKGFVKAEDLGIGTSLVTRAGPALTLSAMTWQTGRAAGESLLGGKPSSFKPASFTVYNLIVAGDHTYFVGTAGGGAWVHNVDCFTPSSYWETQLKPTSYPGISREEHFREANQNLLAAIKANPSVAKAIEKVAPGTRDWLEKTATGRMRADVPAKSPPGLTWHHHADPGRMQLVPRWAHQFYHGAYHPDGYGGYDIWGR